MKRQRSSSSFVVDEASDDASQSDESSREETTSSGDDDDAVSSASVSRSGNDDTRSAKRPTPVKTTWVRMPSTTLCPPSLQKDQVRCLSFLCCLLNPQDQSLCVVGYSTTGPIKFPLLPLQEPRDHCRWRVMDGSASSGTYGVLLFRRASPPTAPPTGDAATRSSLARKLPQVLTTSLASNSGCCEVPMTERVFDVAWLGNGFVGSVPCEERLMVVQYASLNLATGPTAPVVHHQPMPTTVVPLAVCCVDVRCGPFGGDSSRGGGKTSARMGGSGSAATAHRVVVSTMHDGIFTFAVGFTHRGARSNLNNGMHCAMHAVHHITPNFGRNVFAPAVRVVPFAVGHDGLGVPLRSVVPPTWDDVYVACLGPYDSRLFVWHMASSRRIDVECLRELAPLSLTSVGESVLAVEMLGALDHIAVLPHGMHAATRQAQFGTMGHRNHPVAVSAPVARGDTKGRVRRDVVCVLSAEGTLGLIHRVSRTIGGFRYLGDPSPPDSELTHGVFCCLAYNGDGSVDAGRGHCGQSLDATVLSLNGVWTTYQCRFASNSTTDAAV